VAEGQTQGGTKWSPQGRASSEPRSIAAAKRGEAELAAGPKKAPLQKVERLSFSLFQFAEGFKLAIGLLLPELILGI